MDSLGINWFLLSSQLAFFAVIPALIVLGLFLAQARQPSKTFVRVLGFLTAWVTGFSFLFMLLWVLIVAVTFLYPPLGFRIAFTVYTPVKFLGTITVLLMIALMAYYIAHTAKSPLIPDHDRIYHQVAIFFLPFIMMYLHYSKFIKSELVDSEKP